MKKLKTSSLFKLSLGLIIYLYHPNHLLMLGILLYLFFDDKKLFVFGIFIFALIYLRLNYTLDILNYGIVSKIDSYGIEISKPFYKVYLYTEEDFEYGDLIYYEGELKDLKILRDRQKLAANIFFEGELDEFRIIKHNNSIRIQIYNHIQNRYDIETGAFLKKLLLYETDYTSLGDYFKSIGFAQYYLLRSLLKSKKTYLALSIGLIIIFLFGIKIQLIYLLISETVNRLCKNRMHAFAFFIILVCIINPFWLYAYTFVIPLLIRLWAIIENPLSFKALMLIIQAYFFHSISLFRSLFYKWQCFILIVIYLFSLGVLFFPFLAPLYKHLLLEIEMIMNTFDINFKGEISLLYIFIIILIISSYKRLQNHGQVILIITVLTFRLTSPCVAVHFIDVGQGDAILIHDQFINTSILIDTGPPNKYHRLKSFLDAKGIYTIDFLIISHDDLDHSGNLENLSKDYRIKNVIKDGGDIKAGPFYLSHFDLGEYDNANDNSLVYYLIIRNTSFLFTGDISANVERRLIADYGPLNVDVLKLGHHGSISSSSEYFLDCLSPHLGIISTSGLYNHPHVEVINRLNDGKIPYFITKHSGDISYYFSILGQFIRTAKGEFAIINDR